MLLAEGHPSAGRYPIGRVWTEAKIVKDRIGGRISTEAVLIQAVIASILTKGGDKHLKEQLRKVRDGE